MRDAWFNPLLRRASGAAADAAMVARLTTRLPGMVRRPIGLGEARSRLHRRLAHRERSFLWMADHAIYGQPRSPYRWLLGLAGCELGDVRRLVASDGLEGALRTLAERGVYVTFDELKGRRAIVRGSQRLHVSERQFDNPLIRIDLPRFTSGSRGRPSPVPYTLGFMEERATSLAVMVGAHGLIRPRLACWWPMPLHQLIQGAMLGWPLVGWFYPVHPLPAVVHLAAWHLALVGGLAGCRVPLPRRGDLDRPEIVLRWVVGQLRSGEPLFIRATASAAVRLCIAAREAGQDLTGLTLLPGGEPVTAARRRHLEAVGARAYVQYALAELGGIAGGCAAPAAADDVHLMADQYALVQRTRAVVAGGPDVDALLVSSLSRFAPKIALNAETGDAAHVAERECGCQLGALGLRIHLSEIRSFEKMTGEGATFARSGLEQILEELLPARFGGSSVDYQLVEEETGAGATRLVLRVSPSVGAVDAAAAVATLLDALGRGDPVGRYHAGLWRGAGTVTVRRERPMPTTAGKVLPFQLVRRAAPASPS